MPLPTLNLQKLVDSSSCDEEKELLKLFPEVERTLRQGLHTEPKDELLDVMDHFNELVEYNLPYGKKSRALMFVNSYQEMVRDASEADLKVIRVIGWCYEMHYTAFKICDQLIFDRAVDKEGRPCYHRVMDNGYDVTNDVYYLDSSAYNLMHLYIKDTNMLAILEPMFRRAKKLMVIGQNILQETLFPGGEVDFSMLTSDKYNDHVKYRTSYYSFFVPVKMAMYLAGIKDSEGLQLVEDVALKLGHFAQVKEDFLNCYGSKEVFGKSGSNIALSRICWLIVSALNAANGEQREILKANYGKLDKICIDKVKAVYNDLDLKGSYRQYEKKTYQELMTEISKMRDDLPKQLLLDTANRIMKWENTVYY